MIKVNNKKGSIGITIVMLVFCMLMAVSMSYHKTIQTENIIKNNVNYSDRAMDAAFSGVNYAMAVIQSEKAVFYQAPQTPTKVLFVNEIKAEPNTKQLESKWVSLASDLKFANFYDEDRHGEQKYLPPYRFKVACITNSYKEKEGGERTILIKSYGEYLKYDDETVIGTYSAQIMAECKINNVTRTISLKKYRKMQPQITYKDDGTENINGFFSFSNYNQDT